ncbi:hypothetical protein MAP00_002460 [Monascus purpureus]|nr:hypothetical protein MAP00_002460 [Monascus purpureus]
MEMYINALLKLLGAMAQDATLPFEQRQQATYAYVLFFTHRNPFRLMVHIAAIYDGKFLIHPSHQAKIIAEDRETPVNRFGRFINAIVVDFKVVPTVGDFEGHPIELVTSLDPAIENALDGVERLRVHSALLSAEKKANEDLVKSTRKYGYHYIFRFGLRQYYMTRTVASIINFWGQDARGNEYRVRAQKVCYEVMEAGVKLNAAEKRAVIQALHCAPEDAYAFWNWMERNRSAYFAMKACISLLEAHN